jgi:hypothetical protein
MRVTRFRVTQFFRLPSPGSSIALRGAVTVGAFSIVVLAQD